MSQLHAGIATVDVTPPVGTWMAGFAGRNKGSQGIHDPLRSRVLVLDDGSTRLCLITNDIISLSYETVDELKARIDDQIGIPPERVMINCSHTHSGPATRPAGGVYDQDDCYMHNYMRTIVGAVHMAVDDLSPARIGVGRTDVQVGINRRERIPGGGTKLGRNPELPVAPYADVWRIDAPDGTPRAIFFAHACHPVTRAADNYYTSADYPGKAQAVVESVFPGAQAMFGQGCSGNINSEPCGGSFDDVARLGTVLGGAVIKCAAMLETDCEVTLKAALSPTRIPLQDPPPLEEAEAQAEEARKALADAEAGGIAQQVKVQSGYLRWATRVLDLAREGATGRSMRYDLHAITVNDKAIIGLPGEVFVEYQLNIDAASPFGQTTVLGVTNGCPSYIPIASEFEHGGYEVESAIRYYGDTMLDPAGEQVILDEAQRLLRSLI